MCRLSLTELIYMSSSSISDSVVTTDFSHSLRITPSMCYAYSFLLFGVVYCGADS